ncbi:CBS domain-containing protein CBSCBSPB3 [Hordeum vulgare]|nr:CBS domain-containing protein CBSCBSPB3 [Hordeum vulgare]
MGSTAAAVPPSSSARREQSSALPVRSNDRSFAAANTNGNRKKHLSGERLVTKLRLSKPLMLREGTTVYDASLKMAKTRVDVVLLTDTQGLLSSIVTKKDISTQVIAKGLQVEQTTMAHIMTRSPTCVISDSIAFEALQKMVRGKSRRFPLVDNGKVIGMLDIAKCLYDAILRLEMALDKESAIAAAVEGTEPQLGRNFKAPYDSVRTLFERICKPSLSTIVTEDAKVVIVSPSDSVYVATQRMREFQVNYVLVTTGKAVQGIFSSNDVLMCVVSQNLSPELTPVEKVMGPNPGYFTLDMPILDALHVRHGCSFLHFPVRDGEQIVACLDLLHLTHAVIQLVEGGNETANDGANELMQMFWDFALGLEPRDDKVDSDRFVHEEASEETGDGRSTNSPIVATSFDFKLQDRTGRVHRFTFGSESLDGLVSCVRQRLSIDEKDVIQLLYEDEEGDQVMLTMDTDLACAVLSARSVGLKVLKLHIEVKSKTGVFKPLEEPRPRSMNVWLSKIGFMAGAVGGGAAVMACLKRSRE